MNHHAHHRHHGVDKGQADKHSGHVHEHRHGNHANHAGSTTRSGDVDHTRFPNQVTSSFTERIFHSGHVDTTKHPDHLDKMDFLNKTDHIGHSTYMDKSEILTHTDDMDHSMDETHHSTHIDEMDHTSHIECVGHFSHVNHMGHMKSHSTFSLFTDKVFMLEGIHINTLIGILLTSFGFCTYMCFKYRSGTGVDIGNCCSMVANLSNVASLVAVCSRSSVGLAFRLIAVVFGIVVAMVFSLTVAVLYETLNILVHAREQKLAGNIRQSQSKRLPKLEHGLTTIIRLANIILAYTMMLCVMTMNVWLFLSIILGSGIGHLLIRPILLRKFDSERIYVQSDIEFTVGEIEPLSDHVKETEEEKADRSSNMDRIVIKQAENRN